MGTLFCIRDIIPMEDLNAMGRRRGQYPSVFKTSGKRPLFYFKARIDKLDSKDGQRIIARPMQRFYLGYVGEIGKREAERLRNEILTEAINKPQVFIPSQIRFDQVLKLYRENHMSEGLKETSRAVLERILVRHFDSTKERQNLGHLRMCDLDVLTIQQWLNRQSVSACTKKQHVRVLRHIWKKARSWGYTQQAFPDGDVFSFGPDSPKKGKEMPTMDQLRRLLAALEDPYRAMAEIALFAGLRIGEIRGLKWEDVTAETLSVRRRVSEMDTVGTPKSKRAIRTLDVRPVAHVFERLKSSQAVRGETVTVEGVLQVPLSRGRLASYAGVGVDGDTQCESGHGGDAGCYRLPDANCAPNKESHCRANYPHSRVRTGTPASGFIFFHPRYGYSMCRYVMGQAAAVAGITIARWGWHHLRGAFNTLARSSGADSVDRQALMGHATERMNAVYVMPDGGELRRRGDLMMQVQGTILGETKGVQ
jgi:integrase